MMSQLLYSMFFPLKASMLNVAFTVLFTWLTTFRELCTCTRWSLCFPTFSRAYCTHPALDWHIKVQLLTHARLKSHFPFLWCIYPRSHCELGYASSLSIFLFEQHEWDSTELLNYWLLVHEKLVPVRCTGKFMIVVDRLVIFLPCCCIELLCIQGLPVGESLKSNGLVMYSNLLNWN